MTAITNRISLEEASDLLDPPARACVGFVMNDRPHVEPVTLQFERGRFMIGLDASLPLDRCDEVVLVVDEGLYYFDLRAVYVRGTPRPVGSDDDAGRRFEIEATKISCWDYGRLRAVA